MDRSDGLLSPSLTRSLAVDRFGSGWSGKELVLFLIPFIALTQPGTDLSGPDLAAAGQTAAHGTGACLAATEGRGGEERGEGERERERDMDMTQCAACVV
ncbi:hypothetical protein PLESTB_001230300 [Pleodorina starrii]|uniref:Uncharacterized protein n=1 Tax=Pleodorina starrii TaxID=330485 RepID=A0A9W6BSW1_9CHLO|nr:hypothetical protein PLESTM_000229800 [Pleodorina starrii]GLC57468.1 hypothetical protein PLESTB_001230300 [Pleodorina starrii]GLC77641.1 hypothetical protein PLESTF_001966700 [Pleodorina starrii]